MERDRHDTICCVECFFNTVTVMNINVDIQNPLVILEEFQNGQDNIVDLMQTQSHLVQFHKQKMRNKFKLHNKIQMLQIFWHDAVLQPS